MKKWKKRTALALVLTLLGALLNTAQAAGYYANLVGGRIVRALHRL